MLSIRVPPAPTAAIPMNVIGGGGGGAGCEGTRVFKRMHAHHTGFETNSLGTELTHTASAAFEFSGRICKKMKL
jgi:hypothetical protein